MHYQIDIIPLNRNKPMNKISTQKKNIHEQAKKNEEKNKTKQMHDELKKRRHILYLVCAP